MFSSDRQQHREMFATSWRKYRNDEALTPLEKQIADVVAEHPEYHEIIDDTESIEWREFTVEAGMSNPFLHMGLHLGLREQVGTDRPAGIKSICRSLLIKHSGEGHQVEHLMMECLAESLWQAQRSQQMPDEQAYMEALHRLL